MAGDAGPQERSALTNSWAQNPQIKELSTSLGPARTARKPSSLAEAMKRMQEHRENMKFYMGLATMQHETNMIINSNIGAGTVDDVSGLLPTITKVIARIVSLFNSTGQFQKA